MKPLVRCVPIRACLLQHPVPSHLDKRAAFEAIDAAKDVDGATVRSLGTMALGLPGFVLATSDGITRSLDA